VKTEDPKFHTLDAQYPDSGQLDRKIQLFLTLQGRSFKSDEIITNGFPREKTTFRVHPLKNHFETFTFQNRLVPFQGLKIFDEEVV
jgi:hypothetical protein